MGSQRVLRAAPAARQQHYRREGDYGFQRTVLFPGGSTATFGPGDPIPVFHANSAFNHQVDEIDRLLAEVNATIARNRTFVPGDDDTDERLSEDESNTERRSSFVSAFVEDIPSVTVSASSPSARSLSTSLSPTASAPQLGQNLDIVSSQVYDPPSRFFSSSAPVEHFESTTSIEGLASVNSDYCETTIMTTSSPPTIAVEITPPRRACATTTLSESASHSRSESGHHLIPPTAMRWQQNATSSRLGRMARERGLGVAITTPYTTTPVIGLVEDQRGIDDGLGSAGGNGGTVNMQLMEEGRGGSRGLTRSPRIATADIRDGTAWLPIYYRSSESSEEVERRQRMDRGNRQAAVWRMERDMRGW
ncbi:MAG: hypothetical protein M1835_001456 [Candelina submexicana]|nr:MAG: hypothetical protein M1835_001456 [Candelina submexicana]